MPSTSKNFTAPSVPALNRESLRPDCSNCFALCCTALGFSRTIDFAVDKPAGTPCQNLAPDFSCTIHDSLRPRGFRGCTVFDCFGAGQNVSQNLFGGISWKASPESAKRMFPAFEIVRQLHEMLWYLTEAGTRTFDPDTSHQVDQLRRTIESAMTDARQVLSLNLGDLHARVRSVLMDVSEEVRASYLATGDDHLDIEFTPGADLMGRKLRSRPMCGANLRGAYLIAADLRDCDLSGADLLGADLRDARFEGADLSKALYLTQAQLNAAQGNTSTRLPADLDSPLHWSNNSQEHTRQRTE
ncbi:pentapeptide repeat-containing protein [Arthrobacter burdickii]|uniref:Pentapeptide repeat-containing protein n=1 Tax=Arthrobacter burdickii TaxID=3035920 RepID=A0ABT8JXW9_9MICC|nr:pentapeptide repeat-containing protein [Arthrobacter burdickii]MDN4610013.1 pentapeptide repeat-containing protein [Arthrobacter burdickii]